MSCRVTRTCFLFADTSLRILKWTCRTISTRFNIHIIYIYIYIRINIYNFVSLKKKENSTLPASQFSQLKRIEGNPETRDCCPSTRLARNVVSFFAIHLFNFLVTHFLAIILYFIQIVRQFWGERALHEAPPSQLYSIHSAYAIMQPMIKVYYVIHRDQKPPTVDDPLIVLANHVSLNVVEEKKLHQEEQKQNARAVLEEKRRWRKAI